MTTWKQLSRPMRLTLAAPWLLVLTLATSALEPSFHALQVNTSTHQPTEPLDIGSGNVTGTLADARLSTNVVRFGTDGSLATGELDVTGSLSVDNTSSFDGGDITTNGAGALYVNAAVVTPAIYSAGGDPSIDLSNPAIGYLRDDGAPILAWGYDGVTVNPRLLWDGGLSGSDGDGNVSLGRSLYVGDATGGAGIYNSSGGSLVDDNNGGWATSGTLTADNFVGAGSNLTGYAMDLVVSIADSAGTAGYADNAYSAAYPLNAFDDFFHYNGYNQDISFPGDGSFSLSSGSITGDPDGYLSAYRIESRHELTVGYGIGLFGHPAPVEQPAAIANATNASDVITRVNAILAALRDSGYIAE